MTPAEEAPQEGLRNAAKLSKQQRQKKKRERETKWSLCSKKAYFLLCAAKPVKKVTHSPCASRHVAHQRKRQSKVGPSLSLSLSLWVGLSSFSMAYFSSVTLQAVVHQGMLCINALTRFAP
jgi:hypothetical protein